MPYIDNPVGPGFIEFDFVGSTEFFTGHSARSVGKVPWVPYNSVASTEYLWPLLIFQE